MLKDQLPVGILKVDFDLALESEKICTSPILTILSIQSKLKNLPKEVACVVCLDTRDRPLCIGLLGYGTECDVDMSAKEITQFALLSNASGVVLVHNHPSKGRLHNSLAPSETDLKVTSKVADALKLFGVTLNDHIICNGIWEDNQRWPAFYSMREKKKYKSMFIEEPIITSVPSFSGKGILNEYDEKLEIKEDSVMKE